MTVATPWKIDFAKIFSIRARSKFWGARSEDRGGGDNSIQFIVDKTWGMEGWVTTICHAPVYLYTLLHIR